MDIEARKIALVKQILNIENERFIKELEAKLLQLFPKYQSSFKNKQPLHKQQNQNNSTAPITEIRENVSLNELVAEQQTIPISYKEIQKSTKETKWKHSLTVLLEALRVKFIKK